MILFFAFLWLLLVLGEAYELSSGTSRSSKYTVNEFQSHQANLANQRK